MAEPMEPFDNYALHAVARDCWERGVTGVLHSEVLGYSKDLFFRDGVVIFANSQDPADKLPQVLMGQGRFTEEQFEAVEPNFNPEISVGRNLVDMGLITQQELIEGARAQVFHIFQGILSAREGQYEVEEGDLPDGVVNLPLDFPADFLKTFLNLEDRAWISAQFGEDLGFVPHKVEDRPIHFEQVEVADYAQDLYDMIDGENDGNHLAFESDVEDFTLLKFLYALKAMDYIKVDVEPALDPEDEALLDDDEASVFAEELAEAVNQNEQVEKLGMAGFEETMEIGGAAGDALDDGMPSMDATVELSRASLTGSEPESIFEDDTSEDDDDEALAPPEEDYDAAIAAFEEDDDAEMLDEPELVQSADEGEDEDDQGFDDLSSDLLEKELEAMAHPLGASLDSEPEDEEADAFEAEETTFEEEEAVGVGVDPTYQRRMLFSLLLLTLGGFALSWQRGLIDPAGTLSRLGLDMLGPVDESYPIADPAADLAMVEDGADGTDTVENASTDPPVAAQDSETPVDNGNAVADAGDTVADGGRPAEPPKKEPAVKEADSNPGDTQVAAVLEQPTPQPQDEPVPLEDKLDPLPEGETDVAETAAKPDPTPRFVSPVAGGWDPATGRPVAGGSGISMRAPGFELPDLPPAGPALVTPAANSPWAALLARREPGAPLPTAAVVRADDTKAGEKQSVKAAVKVEKGPRPSPKGQPKEATAEVAPRPPTKVPAEDRFAELMRNSQAALKPSGERYTLRLFLACQPSSVAKAQAKAGADSPFYLLPRDFRGRTCYSVCWGVFDSRLDALEYRTQLPEGIVEKLADVEVFRIKTLL